MGSSPLPHIAIFPFLSKGHTIPLIYLAHHIHRHHLATLTFLTTPLNAPFLRNQLSGTETDIIELHFPENIPDIPSGIESTDHLPSISLFLPFVNAIKLLKPHLERALASLGPSVSFLISDGFLGWTNESAAKFGIPRIIFNGMGNFAMTVSAKVAKERLLAGIESPSQPFAVPGFSNLQLTRADLHPPFDDPEPSGPIFEFVTEQAMASMASPGMIANSFYELEADYFECWNQEFGPKAWCVGPVCLARPKSEPELVDWLDTKSAVLYVAFGSQADLSVEQVREIATGLESSGLDFVWVVRAKNVFDFDQGFEERVGSRGKVVRKWVDQIEILRHESVKGFMSHCGWNSVLESVCAGVPILAWPMMAEQRLNAKFVVDVIGVGVRVRAKDGSRDGLVVSEDISEMAKELMLGEKGKVAREKVRKLAFAAEVAMEKGGSSATALEQMIDEVSRARKIIQE